MGRALSLAFILFLLSGSVALAGSAHGGGAGGSGGPAPTVSTVLPNNGGTAGGTNVTITGTNLTGATSVSFGSFTATPTVNSSTSISVTSPAGSGSNLTVSVTTSNGSGSKASAYTYLGPTQSLAAGTTDANGVVLGGTEGRTLYVHPVANGANMQITGVNSWAHCSNASTSWDGTKCWILAGGYGFWKDSNCATNSLTTNQGPQVDILVSSQASWVNDLNLSEHCSGFDGPNAMLDGAFTYDSTGASINTDLLILTDSGTFVWTRNDGATTGSGWNSLNMTLGGTVNAMRAVGHHVDTSQTATACADSNCRDYLMLGIDPVGVASAVYNTSTQNFVYVQTLPWSVDGTGSNLCTTSIAACTNLNSQWTGLNFGGNGCVQVQDCIGNLRIMSIVDCPVTSGGNGKTPSMATFVSVGWNIWRVKDAGASSYMVLWNVAPNSIVQTSNTGNGFRGLSCIPDGAGGWTLLANASIDGSMIKFDPNTQMVLSPPGSYGGTTEVNLKTCQPDFWSSAGGTRISGYNGNDMIQVNNSIIIGEGNSAGTPTTRPQYSNTFEALGGFWMRPVTGPSGGGHCNGYTLYPPSAGSTSSLPNVLNNIATNTCGNGSSCTNTYNGNANPTTSVAFQCATDGNGYCKVIGSTREIRCSPFPEDGATAANGQCGQVLFWVYRDMENGGSGHNTAGAIRLPIDASVNIP